MAAMGTGSGGGGGLTKLQAAMRAKLQGGQFRFLNEQLYTRSGEQSFDMMNRTPELFDAYHAGFRQQVSTWPVNPLDILIAEVQKGSPSGSAVADFGCGEARLAKTLMPQPGPAPGSSVAASSSAAGSSFRVHSFDLVATANDPYVVACSMEAVPLPTASIDVAVYCLSLMGSNYSAFLAEGARTLKPGGRLLIAEVKSRFAAAAAAGEGAEGGHARSSEALSSSREEPRQQQHKRKRASDGGAKASEESAEEGDAPLAGPSSGLDAFVSLVRSLGFTLQRRDESSTMFVLLYFRKDQRKGGAPPPPPRAAAAAATATAPMGRTAGGGAAAAAAGATPGGGSGGEVTSSRDPAKPAKRRRKKKRAALAAPAPSASPPLAPQHVGAAAEVKRVKAGAHAAGGPRIRRQPVDAAAAPTLKACSYKRR